MVDVPSVISLLISLANSTTDPTSFECILPDNDTNGRRVDRVAAICDGAWVLKTGTARAFNLGQTKISHRLRGSISNFFSVSNGAG